MGERLRKGQRRFEDMIELRTAHDVRKLMSCAYCGRMGTADSMVDTSPKQWWHGRCFAKKFGLERLLREDTGRLSRLTIGDLGVDLARHVMSAPEVK